MANEKIVDLERISTFKEENDAAYAPNAAIQHNVAQNLTDAQKVTALNNMYGKVYAPAQHSGLGKVFLDKNNGVLTQAMMNRANTEYVIMYDFTLSEDITIPANCILNFEGGSVKDGTLTGTNTIITYKAPIFTNISISGTWNVPVIYSYMFTDIESDNLYNLFKLASTDVFNKIIIEEGNYVVSFRSQTMGAVALSVCSNTEVIINGTISLDDTQRSQDMLTYGYRMFGVSSYTSIHGRGTLIGDIDLNKQNTEAGHCFYIWEDMRNVEIYNLKISSFAGDGINTSKNTLNIYIHDVEIENWNRNAISIVGGKCVTVDNLYAHDGGFKNPWAIVDVEPNNADNRLENIILQNIIGKNVGVGISSNTLNHECIKNLTIKNLTLDNVSGKFFEFVGTGGSNLYIENVNVVNIPSTHTTGVGDFIRLLNWENVKFDKLNLCCFDIPCASYPLYITQYNNTDVLCIENSKIEIQNCFTYHLKNINIKRSSIKSKNIFWTTDGGLRTTIKDSILETQLAFNPKDSFIENCTIIDSSDVKTIDTTIYLKATANTNNRGIVFKGNIIYTTYSLASHTLIQNFTNNSIIKNNIVKSLDDNKYSQGFVNRGTNNRYTGNQIMGSIESKYVNYSTDGNYSEIHKNFGITNERPSLSIYEKGYCYFDTTLGKPIYWNGTAWVDATGTSV